MKIAIMQPYIFPYIGYFQLINTVDKFIIFDDVNYITKGWINRNRILVNNTDFTFTIPLVEASQNKLIKDISISSDIFWKTKLLRTIEMAYKKAPYFTDSFPLIKEIVNFDDLNLSKYACFSIKQICNYLEIETEICNSSSVYKTQAYKGQDKILEICRQENATEYTNLSGGAVLYDSKSFNEIAVKLNFIKAEEIEYAQFQDDFKPWLSIIDVLMFNSKEQLKSYLNAFILI